MQTTKVEIQEPNTRTIRVMLPHEKKKQQISISRVKMSAVYKTYTWQHLNMASISHRQKQMGYTNLTLPLHWCMTTH